MRLAKSSSRSRSTIGRASFLIMAPCRPPRAGALPKRVDGRARFLRCNYVLGTNKLPQGHAAAVMRPADTKGHHSGSIAVGMRISVNSLPAVASPYRAPSMASPYNVPRIALAAETCFFACASIHRRALTTAMISMELLEEPAATPILLSRSAEQKLRPHMDEFRRTFS